MSGRLGNVYDEAFFARHEKGMLRSAASVLGLLFEHYRPYSVIDIGCGRGAWLAAAEALGATALTGMDGEWVRSEALLSPNIKFAAVDFEKAMPQVDRRYDLCMSLEVAEHMPEDKARPFVKLLCSASNVVLFSAAIKHQGGTNHLNEQWQSYWISLFAANRYECFDVFRGALWSVPSVDWWYRQNAFLFVGPDSEIDRKALSALGKPIFDVVHPGNYEERVAASKVLHGDLPVPAYSSVAPESTPDVIDATRLSELRTLRASGGDVRRAVRLCEEINLCCRVGARCAVIMLTNALIEELPALLGLRGTAESAKGYCGSESFEGAMEYLARAARGIADSYLHRADTRAGEGEIMPVATHVEVSSPLDFLLTEIIRVHR